MVVCHIRVIGFASACAGRRRRNAHPATATGHTRTAHGATCVAASASATTPAGHAACVPAAAGSACTGSGTGQRFPGRAAAGGCAAQPDGGPCDIVNNTDSVLATFVTKLLVEETRQAEEKDKENKDANSVALTGEQCKS